MQSPAVVKFNQYIRDTLVTDLSSHVVGDKAYREHMWVLRSLGKRRQQPEQVLEC